MKLFTRCIILFLLGCSFFVYGNDFVEEFQELGSVNWTKGEVLVTGMGILKGENWSIEEKINAHRAAKLDAARKLIQVINNIHVDSNTKVEDIMKSDTLIKRKVSGYVKNFTEKEVRFTKDGICKLDVSLPINGDGSISEIFLGGEKVPTVGDIIDNKEPIAAKPQQIATATPQEEDKIVIVDDQQPKATLIADKSYNQEKYADYQESKLVSGLVVNAANIETRPALNPKIKDTTGETVYSFKKADRDFRKLNGMASYATTLDDAYLDKRVIRTPFIIDAVAVEEGNPCVIIVDKKDADKFITQQGSDRAIKHCRVIIVTENPEKS